jgi:hypothetical protein
MLANKKKVATSAVGRHSVKESKLWNATNNILDIYLEEYVYFNIVMCPLMRGMLFRMWLNDK